MKKRSDFFIDNYILYSVLSQPILVILQFLMLYVYAIPEDVATKYRVLLTALPLSFAIFLSFKRRPKIFIITYVIAIFFLLCQSFLFPSNIGEIWSSTARFLLPIILPSTLCLISIKGSIEDVEQNLLKISWIIVIMMIYFVFCFVMGRTVMFDYNMALAYALLLPAITLYKHKKWYSIISSVFLLLCMLVFGSRGPLVVAVLYIIYDLVQVRKSNVIILMFIFAILILALPMLETVLEDFGISSRTLSFLLSGNIAASEGRDDIYNQVYRLIQDNLLIGVGIFGDRVHLDELCHNIILEIIVNYGIVFGIPIIIFISVYLLKIYLTLDKTNKNRFMKYFIALIVPLFFSDSYLISIYFGLFWGLVFVIKDTRTKIEKPSSKYFNAKFL